MWEHAAKRVSAARTTLINDQKFCLFAQLKLPALFQLAGKWDKPNKLGSLGVIKHLFLLAIAFFIYFFSISWQMWQTKQTRILFGSDAQINSLLTFVLGPSFVWSTTDVWPQTLRRHFSFKLGSTFWKAKIQISIRKNSAVSEML